MQIQTIPTQPIAGQKPGTSGLRKKTQVFMQPAYLETYVQAVIEGVGGVEGREIVVGGDGRYFNDVAIGRILRMLAANGASAAIVGRNGLLSTPAASNLIRTRRAFGGFILSASHNPGGEHGDFGLKFNVSNGGPAPEAVTDAIYARTLTITSYRIAAEAAPDLSVIGTSTLGGMRIEIIDPVTDYLEMMRGLVDFDRIRAMIAGGFTLRFDAMSAVTGPYAKAILEGELGAAPGSVINAEPLPDFGGHHPDPNPVHAADLFALMFSADAPDMGAASDGDGDRNIVLGRGVSVAPSDSLALLAANIHLAKGYGAGLKGIARSMPTSRAADRMFADLRASLPTLAGRTFAGLTVEAADDFTYHDPIDGSVSAKQGVRVFFTTGERAVFRLSGTGTEGATLRVYLEAFEPDPARHDLDPQAVLAGVIAAADAIAGIRERTGRTAPDVVT